jgi:hypothetical protein
MNGYLGGHLIGYGIKKPNGEETKVIFPNPIHNTITKYCINNLLTLNGSNAVATANQLNNYLSMFVKSSGTSDRYGVFNFSALGDGTGNTTVDMSELVSRRTDYTDTKQTGDGWSGSSWNINNASIIIRISHSHAISTDFTVREIGWYNRIYPDGAYEMSARVKLDAPVPVETGDTFYSIYELTVSFQQMERFSDLGGLGGGYLVNAGTTYGWFFPQLNTSCNPWIGEGYENYTQVIPTVRPAYDLTGKLGNYAHAYSTNIVLTKTNVDVQTALSTRPHPLGDSSDVLTYSNVETVARDYVADSLYRDYEILTPGISGTIYGIAVNGTYYRFGKFDANDAFTPTPVTLNSAYKFRVRQSWSTDLLQPSA